MKFRNIILILSVVLLINCFAACNFGGVQETTTPTTEKPTEPSVKENDLYVYQIENGQAVIQKYKGTDRFYVEIPTEIDGYKVVKILSGAFKSDYATFYSNSERNSSPNYVDSVVIPAEIKEIEDGAFDKETVFATDAETKPKDWKDEALSGDADESSSGNIYFDSDINKTKHIKGVTYVFQNKYQSYYVVRSNKNQREVNIPDEIDGIPVTDIGSKCFFENDKIEKITVSKNASYIREEAFYNCINLKEIIFDSPNLSVISSKAFVGCISLDNIVLPENLSKIYSYAFMNCGTIETMVWPANLNFVEKNAFTNTVVNNIIYNGSKEQLAYINLSQCEGLENANVTCLGEQKNIVLEDISEIHTIETGSIVTIKVVYISSMNRNTQHITVNKDNNDALLIYMNDTISVELIDKMNQLSTGTYIEITGTFSMFCGMPELTKIQSVNIIDEYYELPLIRVSIEELNANPSKYFGKYIEFEATVLSYSHPSLFFEETGLNGITMYNVNLSEGLRIRVRGTINKYNTIYQIVSDTDRIFILP